MCGHWVRILNNVRVDTTSWPTNQQLGQSTGNFSYPQLTKVPVNMYAQLTTIHHYFFPVYHDSCSFLSTADHSLCHFFLLITGPTYLITSWPQSLSTFLSPADHGPCPLSYPQLTEVPVHSYTKLTAASYHPPPQPPSWPQSLYSFISSWPWPLSISIPSWSRSPYSSQPRLQSSSPQDGWISAVLDYM